MRLITALVCPIFYGLLFVGCSDATDPPPADPASPAAAVSFQDAVEEIVRLRDQVRDGFAVDDIDAAHDPLHAVGDRLVELPEIAEAAKLTADELASVKESVEILMDAFGAVDATLHGNEGSLYVDESSKIDDAIDSLTKIAGITPVSSPAEPTIDAPVQE